MDIFNLNNVLTTKRKDKIKDLINKKIEDPQFKPNRSDVKSIVTDIDHKLYTQYYRQTHMSNDPILFNRQSGYMPINEAEYVPTLNRPVSSTCCKLCGSNALPYTDEKDLTHELSGVNNYHHHDDDDIILEKFELPASHNHKYMDAHHHNENSCKSKPCIPKDYSWYAKKIETSLPIVGETSVLYKAPPTGSLPLPESLI